MTSPPTFKRFFTPKEANALLDEVRADITAAKSLIQKAKRAKSMLSAATNDEERSDASSILEEHYASINGVLARIRHEGVHVQGLDPVNINFPALRNGREVYLCWLEGDRQIDTWHHVHMDTQARLEVDPMKPGRWEWCN